MAGSTELIERVRRSLNHYGASLDAHAGFLLARGLRTLALRVQAQNHNAARLEAFLSTHPKAGCVNYPGLPTHPDHDHAAKLLSGFGGMLSLRLTGGVPAADALFDALCLPYVAPSLGGVESLITRPAISSHAGIESPDDLVEDFAQALTRPAGHRTPTACPRDQRSRGHRDERGRGARLDGAHGTSSTSRMRVTNSAELARTSRGASVWREA